MGKALRSTVDKIIGGAVGVVVGVVSYCVVVNLLRDLFIALGDCAEPMLWIKTSTSRPRPFPYTTALRIMRKHPEFYSVTTIPIPTRWQAFKMFLRGV